MQKQLKFWTRKFDSSLGQFISSYIIITVFFKNSVSSFLNLPKINNELYDARIELEFNHLYIWNDKEWIDQNVYDANDDIISICIPNNEEIKLNNSGYFC